MNIAQMLGAPVKVKTARPLTAKQIKARVESRQALLDAIASGEAVCAKDLAARLDMTREAVSRKLVEMAEVGLVKQYSSRRTGKNRTLEYLWVKLVDTIETGPTEIKFFASLEVIE